LGYYFAYHVAQAAKETDTVPNVLSASHESTTREADASAFVSLAGPDSADLETAHSRQLSTKDDVFDTFECPPFMETVEMNEGNRKECLLVTKHHLTNSDGFNFGPAVSYLWAGDIGFWTEDIKVSSNCDNLYWIRSMGSPDPSFGSVFPSATVPAWVVAGMVPWQRHFVLHATGFP
jgi:hypothetical protein